jgi:capsule polysaccharide export protein KpsE/RkpR
MTRREQLMARIAEAQAQLATVQGQINDPNTPGSRIPVLESRAANLERQISEMNQELANLPEEAMVAAAGLVAVPASEARKTAGRKRAKQRTP